MRLFVLIIFMILSGCKESNYEQCRLERLGEATSDLAVIEIRNICRDLHPIDKDSMPIRRDLNPEELQKIEGDNANRSFDLFSFDYYNGNSELAISEITIEITIVPKEEGNASPKQSIRVYKDETYAGPLSVGEFSERFISPKKNEKLTWKIIAAKGYIPDN